MAARTEQQEILYDSVEILSQTKIRAESRVRLLRSLHEEGEVDGEQLNRLRILYDEARAEVNSGLDRLLVEFESTGGNSESEPYARVAERASRRAAEFLSESDTVIFGDDRSMIETGARVADTVVGALVDVWKTIRGERVERNKKLAQRIESFKWQSFDAIE